MMTVLH